MKKETLLCDICNTEITDCGYCHVLLNLIPSKEMVEEEVGYSEVEIEKDICIPCLKKEPSNFFDFIIGNLKRCLKSQS